MKHLLTYNVHVVCSEAEAHEIKSTIRIAVNGDDIPDAKVMIKLVEEELLDEGIDAEKLVTDRYKDVGI